MLKLKVAKEGTWFNIDCLILNAIRNKRVIVTIRPLPIYENTIWHSKVLPIIKRLSQVLCTGKQQSQTHKYHIIARRATKN